MILQSLIRYMSSLELHDILGITKCIGKYRNTLPYIIHFKSQLMKGFHAFLNDYVRSCYVASLIRTMYVTISRNTGQ